MEMILAPKPKRSILFHKRNREELINVPWYEYENFNKIHLMNPFEIDISPIGSFMNFQDNKLLTHNYSNSLTNLFNVNNLFLENSFNTNNYAKEATTEIIEILSNATKNGLTCNNNNKLCNNFKEKNHLNRGNENESNNKSESKKFPNKSKNVQRRY